MIHFLAQHYDAIGEHVRALDYVNRGLEHTPTLIELYVAKGRIYKHAGNEVYATECLDEAQSLGKFSKKYFKCSRMSRKTCFIDRLTFRHGRSLPEL